MKESEMSLKGIEHAEKGLPLTPFHCQEIDKEIFAFANNECKNIASDMNKNIQISKIYVKMRGAFNRAWNHRYAELVCNRDA